MAQGDLRMGVRCEGSAPQFSCLQIYLIALATSRACSHL